MTSVASAAFVSLLCLYAIRTSPVYLNDHGYENVVIAISPLVPEDQTIIKNIKDMVTEASFYMFNATKRRFYFSNVKILLPANWKPNHYQKRKHESYEKASALIADPAPKYGDDPYTFHYGRCGERGRYIHFTPNFLLKDSLLSVYGSRGRVFVHEWAHLRWGVFDEYNDDQPFSTSGQNLIKATRCSTDLPGTLVCDGSTCAEGDCRFRTQEELLKKGCTFLADRNQPAAASIMYMQALPSVVDFCNETTHDPEAPHMQNQLCDYQSTWKVIMGSEDYRLTPAMSGTHLPPPPSFSILKAGDRVICLLLDVSEFMNKGHRISRMRQAAEVFLLLLVELGSYVGIVTFADQAEIQTPLTLISDENVRKQLSSYLPTTANGGSSICEGLRSAFQVIQTLEGSNIDGSEIVLLTAGEDSNIEDCLSEVAASGSTIHTIAVGFHASIELEQLADMTAGSKFTATDRVDSNDLIDAFTGISSQNGNVLQQSIQLESAAASIDPAQHLFGFVLFDRTVGNETSFVVTWQPGSEAPAISLQDPHEQSYTTKDFLTDPTSGIAHLQIPGSAEAGNWTYKVVNTMNYSQVLGLTVTSRPLDRDVPPVTVKVHTNKGSLSFPEPMILYAEVTQGFTPVLGARVTAIIEHQFGNPFILELADNGAGADAFKHDGVYSKYFFSPTGNGRHILKIRVQRKSDDHVEGYSPSWSHAMYVPGYIENGKIQMNPPRPTFNDDEMHAIIGGFSRIATGHIFMVNEVPTIPWPDVFPPCKIVELRVERDNVNLYLSWTAPGDNYDQGRASTYEIKMSDNPRKLRDNFQNATSLNTSALIPQASGTRERATFKVNELIVENSTAVYFAICAIDNASLRSDVSNVAQASIWVQRFLVSGSISKQTVSNELFVVIGSVTAICFLASLIVYSLRKANFPLFQRQPNARGRACPTQRIDVSEETEVVLLGSGMSFHQNARCSGSNITRPLTSDITRGDVI